MLRLPARLFSVLVCTILATHLALAQGVSFTVDTTSHFGPIHADFNSDGREDFIAGQCKAGFGLVLSTGDGTYAPSRCYTLPERAPAYYFAIGDFNSDGNADLIVSNQTNTFYELAGSRSGTLHLQATLVAPVGVLSLAAADVNHDGKIDLLFLGGDNNLYVWFGNGDGTFTPGPITAIGVLGLFYIGDFDGDGNADVLSEQGGEGGVSYQVLYGDGTGHFQAAAPFVDDVGYAVYDLNGDGISDLVGEPLDFSVGGDNYYDVVRALYGNANRTFTQNEVALANCDNANALPAVADFNGGGIKDLAVIEASDCSGDAPDTLDVLLGGGHGGYQPEQTIFSTTKAGFLSDAFTLRANRDTKPDVAVGYFSGAVYEGLLLMNTSSGKFPSCSAPDSYTGITLCAPTQTVVKSSAVRFSIGASNQAPGRDVQVWVDGEKLGEQLKGAFSYYSFLDATYKLSNGNHTVTVISSGWDNLQEQITFPLTVGSTTCAPPQSPGVNVCSPLTGSTVGSPVLAWASGTVTGAIARIELAVDGVKEYTVAGKSELRTTVSLSSGPHTFVYTIANTEGDKWKQTVYAIVP